MTYLVTWRVRQPNDTFSEIDGPTTTDRPIAGDLVSIEGDQYRVISRAFRYVGDHLDVLINLESVKYSWSPLREGSDV